MNESHVTPLPSIEPGANTGHWKVYRMNSLMLSTPGTVDVSLLLTYSCSNEVRGRDVVYSFCFWFTCAVCRIVALANSAHTKTDKALFFCAETAVNRALSYAAIVFAMIGQHLISFSCDTVCHNSFFGVLSLSKLPAFAGF